MQQHKLKSPGRISLRLTGTPRFLELRAVFISLSGEWHYRSPVMVMKSKRGFSKEVVAAIRDAKIIGIRAGTKPHRILGIWAVVVENRVFVRSWGLKERGWYHAFLEEPVGVIGVEGREFPVRPVFTRSERLKKLVDRAYAEKFTTPWARHFVRGFARSKKRRDTTTELVMGTRGKGERVKGKS